MTDCVVVNIHPLSYSVANNEDIFEYIKRDILCRLSKEPEFKEIKWGDVIKTLANYDTLLDVADKVTEALSYSKLWMMPFHLFKKVDDKFAIDKFFERFEEQKGGIFERDDFTIAIQEAVSRIKDSGKKCILIIEDLDRLDPGHLFRILNVFGAHIDEDANTNKFGFDNIVLTLDFNTSRHLFYHFYGKEADYEGYMSKFISRIPFYYSIKQTARDNLKEFLIQECHLTHEMLQKPLFSRVKPDNTYMSIADVIDELSVRDIAKILDSVDDQIIAGRKTSGVYDIQAECPLTYFLAVLARMNLPFRHSMLKSIMSQTLDAINILGDCLLCDPRILQGSFKIDDERFAFDFTYDINGYYRINPYPHSTGALNRTKWTEIVDKTLIAVYGWVNDCQQMVDWQQDKVGEYSISIR